MGINLKERLDRADKLVAGLKQNAEDKAAGREPSVKIDANINMKEAQAYRTFLNSLAGNEENAPTIMANLKEMLTSTDTIQMVPHIIEGQMIEAAEPEYLAASMFNTIQVPAGSGVMVMVPVVGEVFVREVGESEPYNEDAPDYTWIEKSYISIAIKKVGAKVSITEEAIADYTWDVYNLSIKKLGQAFGRFKEEKCMNEFTKHGHVVIDNDPNMVAQNPALQSTGLDEKGDRNNTLSMEDFVDIVLASITNDHTPTDCIMHPLTWLVFAKNATVGVWGSWGALGGQNVHPWGGTQGSGAIGGSTQNNMGNPQIITRPEQVQNRLPVPLQIHLSQFVRFDKEKKVFDMYVIDRNDVGVIAQRNGITMGNWTDPERDIRYVKASERYGVGISGQGRGIMVARNLAVATTHPKSIPVHIIADN